MFVEQLVWADIKKIKSSTLLALCKGNPPMTDECPHKGPVMWKVFPFHYVIMTCVISLWRNDIRPIERVRTVYGKGGNG